MSGSNSSAQDGSRAGADPLALTVHDVPAHDLDADRRRTAVGRLKMLLVLAICAAPVIASYFTYFVIRPEGRSNYGTLILPTRSLPPLNLRTLDGQAFDVKSLKGQWLLLAVGPSACDASCDERLFTQRQLREMLGRERERMDKIWLITDGKPPAAALRASAEAKPSLTMLLADAAAVAAWLQPEPGQALESHLYLVDPMGEWMMRFPPKPEPGKVKRDLERLLRASASWDQPGR
jgi:hypothetical protein